MSSKQRRPVAERTAALRARKPAELVLRPATTMVYDDHHRARVPVSVSAVRFLDVERVA